MTPHLENFRAATPAIRFEALKGAFFLCDRSATIGPVRAALCYRADGQNHELDLVGGAATTAPCGGRVEIRVKDENLRADFVLNHDSGVFEVAARVEARKNGVELQSVTLFRLGFEHTPFANLGRENVRFWGNWHDIWFPVGSAPLVGEKNWDELKETRAYHFAALYGEGGALALGFQLPNQWLDGLEFQNNELRAQNTVGAVLKPGQAWQSDRLRVGFGADLNAILPRLHQNHVPRRRAKESGDFSGWNSWEAYHAQVTAQDVLENVGEIAANPVLRDHLRFIIVDDGWQRAWGEWEPNEKFPDGMDGLAAQIGAQGFEAGLWTAPFLVDKNLPLVREQPDWFLHDGDEFLNANGNNYYLDPTHPAVRDHLFALYRKLYDWGFRYFKTDFLVEACQWFVPGRPEFRPNARCFDPNLGIMRGMRAAMQTMRAAMGEDSFWLGCGTDIGCGAGLMDASRTGGDIGPFWTRVPNQARSVIHHGHLHGNLFLADPDFALVKGSDTFQREFLDVPLESPKPYVVDAWEGGRCFDLQDARTWASLVILSGGIVNLSDRIRGLNEPGLEILETVLKWAGGRAAVPLDWENGIPRVLLREESHFCLLGVFNWDNEEAVEIEVENLEFPDAMQEIWTGETLRVENGALRLNLKPHESRLFWWGK